MSALFFLHVFLNKTVICRQIQYAVAVASAVTSCVMVFQFLLVERHADRHMAKRIVAYLSRAFEV